MSDSHKKCARLIRPLTRLQQYRVVTHLLYCRNCNGRHLIIGFILTTLRHTNTYQPIDSLYHTLRQTVNKKRMTIAETNALLTCEARTPWTLPKIPNAY